MYPDFKDAAETVTDDLPLSTEILKAAIRYGQEVQPVVSKIFAAVVELERRVIAIEGR